MSQKVLIDDVEYKISGGKVLIGGKKYKIVSGKTLINGKVLKIDFGGKVPVKVYIDGGVSPATGGVTVNGTVYQYGSGYIGDVYAGDTIFVNGDLWVNGDFRGGSSFVVPNGITRINIELSYDETRDDAVAHFTY